MSIPNDIKVKMLHKTNKTWQDVLDTWSSLSPEELEEASIKTQATFLILSFLQDKDKFSVAIFRAAMLKILMNNLILNEDKYDESSPFFQVLRSILNEQQP